MAESLIGKDLLEDETNGPEFTDSGLGDGDVENASDADQKAMLGASLARSTSAPPQLAIPSGVGAIRRILMYCHINC